MSPIVRFAPSPTGYLHVGNIRAALINWLYARAEGGTFILRLDDTDPERSKEEYATAIRKDLDWLGLAPDREVKQSDRLGLYDKAKQKLIDMGRLYPCYETAEELDFKRKMQLARKQPPVYDRGALNLSDEERKKLEDEGRRPHWRFRLDAPGRVEFDDLIRGPVSIDMDSVSDPILVREDGSYLYTLPSVVDDLDLGITHIVRGEDHVTNSAVQVQIFETLGGKAPDFAHFSLFRTKEGELSKRRGSLSIAGLRGEGLEPMAILSLLARLGTSDPVEAFQRPEDIAESFSFDKFSRGTVIFDKKELAELNAKVLHGMDVETARKRLGIADLSKEFWNTVRPNLERIADVQDWWRIVNGPVDPVIADEDKGFIEAARENFPEGALNEGSWTDWTNALKDKTGRKGRQLFMPLRQALTGESRGPELNLLLPLIGRERALKRLAGERA